MNRTEKKQEEQDVRKKANNLICHSCEYLGKVKDGRDAFFCHNGVLSTVLVIDKDYSNYISGLHIRDLILNTNDDYCCTQAGRMAYEQGLFTLKITGRDD